MSSDRATELPAGSPASSALPIPRAPRFPFFNPDTLPPDFVEAESLAQAPLQSVRASWYRFAEEDPSAGVELHPALVFAPRADPRGRPLLFLRCSAGADELPRIRSMALLVEKPCSLRLLPARRVTLRGRRFAGTALAGEPTPESASHFVERAIMLLNTGECDCLLFEELDAESELWNAIQAARSRRDVAVFHPAPPQDHWTIQFPDDPTLYWSQQFSGKTRNTLRRKIKKLEHSFLRFTTPEEVPAFLAKSFAVSQTSWQTRRLGQRIRNSPEELSYFTILARLGALRGYVLEHNDRPIAFVFGTQWKGRFAYEELAYDPAFAEFSPGTVLLYRILEDLVTRDTPRIFDFGLGDAAYKQLFANRQSRSGPVMLVHRTRRTVTAMRMDRFWKSMAGASRRILRATGAMRIVRKLYRR